MSISLNNTRILPKFLNENPGIEPKVRVLDDSPCFEKINSTFTQRAVGLYDQTPECLPLMGNKFTVTNSTSIKPYDTSIAAGDNCATALTLRAEVGQGFPSMLEGNIFANGTFSRPLTLLNKIYGDKSNPSTLAFSDGTVSSFWDDYQAPYPNVVVQSNEMTEPKNLNLETKGIQDGLAISQRDEDEYAACWSSKHTGFFEVFCNFFRSDNSRIFAKEFQVSNRSFTGNEIDKQSKPAVACDLPKNCYVAWQGATLDKKVQKAAYNIFYRQINEDGTFATDIIQLTNSIYFDNTYPSLSALSINEYTDCIEKGNDEITSNCAYLAWIRGPEGRHDEKNLLSLSICEGKIVSDEKLLATLVSERKPALETVNPDAIAIVYKDVNSTQFVGQIRTGIDNEALSNVFLIDPKTKNQDGAALAMVAPGIISVSYASEQNKQAHIQDFKIDTQGNCKLPQINSDSSIVSYNKNLLMALSTKDISVLSDSSDSKALSDSSDSKALSVFSNSKALSEKLFNNPYAIATIGTFSLFALYLVYKFIKFQKRKSSPLI